jgi:protein O-mannosyl-transferase
MKKVICILLSLLVLGIYWKVQYHEFINYDDGRYIIENKHVKSGLSKENFIWAFTQVHSANWHPVTWLSHMLDSHFYGLNPNGHHLSSLGFHIANSLLLFLLLCRMTGEIWKSCFVASLFAFHPINIESVAWASERKSVLSTFFLLLTMWAYINYVQKKNFARYSIVLLFFILGLMSKPMLVTLPFVFLLLDYWPLNRFKISLSNTLPSTKVVSHIKNNLLNLFFEKIPLLILVAGSCVITLIAQKSWGAVVSLENVSLVSRISNALVSYLKYLEKMAWPTNFSIFYPYPENGFVLWEVLMSGLVLITITFISIRLIKKAPYLVVGWFWYLGTLIPVIGLVQVGQQAMADRYAYVPLIGIFIIIAWGLPELLKNYLFRKKLLIFLTGIYFSILMTLCWTQLQYWKSSIKIFQHAINVTERKYPSFVGVYNNLGVVLISQMKFEEATVNLKKAVELQPNYPESYNNLGYALSELKRFSEADIQYKQAIRLKPDYAEAHNNLANSLSKKSSFNKAIIHYKKAIQYKPDFSEAHFNLGVTLNKSNHSEKAIPHLEEAIRLEPNFFQAHLTLGNILTLNNNFERAIYHLETTIKLNPNNAIAHNSLGSIFGQQKKFKKSITYFKTSLKINPFYKEAHQNLGIALAAMGFSKQSAHHLKIANEIENSLKDD